MATAQGGFTLKTPARFPRRRALPRRYQAGPDGPQPRLARLGLKHEACLSVLATGLRRAKGNLLGRPNARANQKSLRSPWSHVRCAARLTEDGRCTRIAPRVGDETWSCTGSGPSPQRRRPPCSVCCGRVQRAAPVWRRQGTGWKPSNTWPIHRRCYRPRERPVDQPYGHVVTRADARGALAGKATLPPKRSLPLDLRIRNWP